ncbi:MAG: sugar O-acetyltransferase [Muribaculaceae bacterium]|nr:sugar O-acetyltransferase [Muribaculaceae bacterium]
MKEESNKITYLRSIEHLVSTNRLEQMIKADTLVRKLNSIPITEQEELFNTIKSLFGGVGNNPSISNGFHCDFGDNIHVGDNFYAGYNCTMLDYAQIIIGDNCLISPNVGIYTTGHELHPKDRYKSGYAMPIKIGNNVWIGGNCCILPGVTIGDGAVIAAGSVVNRDVESNILVAGNPIKFIKNI